MLNNPKIGPHCENDPGCTKGFGAKIDGRVRHFLFRDKVNLNRDTHQLGISLQQLTLFIAKTLSFTEIINDPPTCFRRF